MVSLDSDILISFLKGDRAAQAAMTRLNEGGGALKTTVVNAYELLKGARSSKRGPANLEMVKAFISELETLQMDTDSSEIAASLFRDLEVRGMMVNEFDVLVAGIVLRNGEILMTRDTGFKRISGLGLQEW